jgi:hypothetical protein
LAYTRSQNRHALYRCSALHLKTGRLLFAPSKTNLLQFYKHSKFTILQAL